MQNAKPSLFARDDTFFGICEGLAEDLGFNALWLRLAFTFALFVNPVAAASAYLALGVVVFTTRWFVPTATNVEQGRREVERPHAGNDDAPAPNALAA
jgi:phage shock protein PspC (stress-responsive transcriptional regulator)